MQQAQKFWDSRAEKYARSAVSDMDAYNLTLKKAGSYLKDTDRVLEIGCGTGTTALHLAKNAGHITATDISPNMIGIGRKKAEAQSISNVSFKATDIYGVDAADGPYDAVMAFNVLHLLEDTERDVGHINALLKPGGLFISKTVCTPESGAPFKFCLMMTVLPAMQMLGMAPFVGLRKISVLEALVRSQGFEIVETGNYPESPPSRFIVARKT